MILFKSAFALVFLVHFSTCARILGIFQMASYSHFIVGEPLFKELAARGHEVTVISPYPQKTPIKNYRDIDLPESRELVKGMQMDLKGSFVNFGSMPTIVKLFFINSFGHKMVETVFKNKEVEQLINSDEKFDLVIMQVFANDGFAGFAHKFKAPLMLVFTGGPSSWTNKYFGNPTPLSFTPEPLVSYSPDMNFWQRLHNAFTYVASELVAHLYALPKHNALMHTYFPDAPHIYDLLYNASFILLNSSPGLSAPVPLLPNMKEIGGIHIKKNVTLPADLKKFLDESKDGVIYFALGSNLKSKDLPPEKLKAILAAFKRWGKPVLWKFEDENLPEKADNIKISKWLPQLAVLEHPNVKAFITHGGRLSTLESIYFGVPIIGIPIFAEQPYNIAQAVHAGYGTWLDLQDLTEETLYNAIVEITSNPKYSKQAKFVSKAMQQQNSLEEAVFWTEYVLEFQGAPHLRSYGVNLPWYQYLLVDVVLFAVVVVVLVNAVIVYIMLRLCKKSKPKTKLKKK